MRGFSMIRYLGVLFPSNRLINTINLRLGLKWIFLNNLHIRIPTLREIRLHYRILTYNKALLWRIQFPAPDQAIMSRNHICTRGLKSFLTVFGFSNVFLVRC